jgi:prepilin-type N-terminal cleavage/methylation domain-containing protein
MTKKVSPKTCRGVRRGERLTNCSRDRCGRRYNAFTLIELIVVVGIILVLSGLVLSTAGYARKKGARARAETEIAAMSAACENYKADNGVYPRNSDTDNLNVQTSGNPSSYQAASQYLYGELSGDRNFNYVIDVSEQGNRSYFVFRSKPPPTDGTSNSGMLSITRTGTTYTVNYILDPFGNSYGYSTRMAATGSGGYNPTFDLWSTAGDTSGNQNLWIKNW